METQSIRSPDPAWLDGAPVVCRVGADGRPAVIVQLSDAGIRAGIEAGCGALRNAARGTGISPDIDGESTVWRYAAAPLPALPAHLESNAVLDGLLGRADVRQPIGVGGRRGADDADLALHVPADTVWFKGHFDSDAVLPGIVQIGWAISAARDAFARPPQPSSILQLKFKSPIRPDAIIGLHLRVVNSDEIAFAYRSAVGESASGRLVYRALQS